MEYSAKAVANFFLDIAEQDGRALSPMKLQKLVYFAHGWNLGIYDEPLITDPIEAWPFGPVIPDLYHEFKHCGNGAIKSRATEVDWETLEFVPPKVDEDDSRSRALMRKIWKIYGDQSALKLSNLTHETGTPWELARRDYDDSARNIPIDDASIRRYFKERVEKNRQKA